MNFKLKKGYVSKFPRIFKGVSPNDKQRLQRAFLVYKYTRKPLWVWQKKYKKFLEYNDIGNLNTIKAGDQLQVPVLANVATSAKQTEPEEVNQSSSLAKVEAKPTQKTTPPVVLESSMEASVNSSENILSNHAI